MNKDSNAMQHNLQMQKIGNALVYLSSHISDLFLPVTNFCDDEFSDNEIEFMDFVIEKYGDKSASELVNITHHEHSPWYTTALANNVLEPLENETLSYTDFIIDMKQLIAHDSIRLALYNDYVSQNGYAD